MIDTGLVDDKLLLNGPGIKKAFIDLVYPHVDLIYFDIKIMDSHSHKKYCGIPNKTIIENFIKLHGKYLASGVEVMPRTPLIPEITDTKENLGAIVAFYKKKKVKKNQLLDYHLLWQEKNKKIGIIPVSVKEANLEAWMSDKRLTLCEKFFIDQVILMVS